MILAKYAPVQSKFTAKKGIVTKIEHDEFYNCLMYRVDFEPQVNHQTEKFEEYQQWWFKAMNLVEPGSKEMAPYPFWNEKEPRDKHHAA